jgi:hypothetical protein
MPDVAMRLAVDHLLAFVCAHLRLKWRAMARPRRDDGQGG